ncbi:MAG TPA: VanW family protein [Candidatus Saccharimonadales bacterium]|nr:VanW family protein [Candidatus Saccharimonadales bacterium]
MKNKLAFKNILVFTALLMLAFLIYMFLYREKVLPNVYVSDSKVSSMGQDELSSYLASKSSDFLNKPIVINVFDDNPEQITTSFSELGISYNVDATVFDAYNYGRNHGIIGRVWAFLKSPFKKTFIKPEYLVEGSQFSSTFSKILKGHEITPVDATIVYDRNGFEIQKEKNGRTYDHAATILTLRQRLENFSTEPVEVALFDLPPQVDSAGASKALAKVKILNNQKITLSFEGDTWQLTGANLMNNLKFVPAGASSQIQFNLGNGPVALKNAGLGDFGNLELEVSLDDAYLEKYIADIAEVIDVKTVDATVAFDGQRITSFTPAIDGRRLDERLTKDLILSKVSAAASDAGGEIAIKLPVAVTKAKIQNDEINSLGIRELIGKGVSYFGGSIANRAYNIGLAASRVNGTIVKAGEIFSFNKTVGEISGTTGYRQAYVISAGHTVLDDGGGVCQVSTTLFRAALNTGLPIVARTAHAYRVGYYEQHGFKPGLDATVFSPSVDFAFKNDTDHAILVQAIYDGVNARLEVDIYGTTDGRRVELSDPVVSNVSAAPEAKYQDDPTLPKGTVKQVDFAAGGATSVFTRKVYKGDKVLTDDVFKSVFRPWQAVYLVGTQG